MMSSKKISYSLILMVALFTGACSDSAPEDEVGPLPYLGFHDINGQDTVYHKIPKFAFVNQDSVMVTNETFNGKLYIADFFFTSCPTICPKVTKNMLQLYKQYEGNDSLLFLSHTIDTKRDSVERLKKYADNLGVSSDKWMFVTGDKDEIYEIADDYMSIATENPDAPGGFDHSGWLLLIDDQGHIRSFVDGTKDEKVEIFKKDIDWMLKHM